MRVLLHGGHEHATATDQAVLGSGETVIVVLAIFALAAIIAFWFRYLSDR